MQSGVPATFTEEVVKAMSEYNSRPVIFALSNPTDRAECTAEQAYQWSDGRAVFASGSPFGPVEYNGTCFRPTQGNNAYIFPGVGLGAVTACAKRLPPSVFLRAAAALADSVTDADLQEGALYPRLQDIRRVSVEIAVTVAEGLSELGLGKIEDLSNLHATLHEGMYDPMY
jgi:malate dehydrogenase (oxaloacetate-decarboxylating)(NADP+)